MSDTKEVELEQIADLINGDRGKNYPSEGDFVDSGIPFINAGHLADGRVEFSKMNYISDRRFELLGSGKIRKNDILYCLRGSLGKTAIYRENGPAAIASSLVIIRPRNECNADYLYHFLASPLGQREIRKYDNGSSQPNLSATSLKNYLLPLPPLDKQRRIAAILDKADALHQKRSLAIQKLNSLDRSIFLDMFGAWLNESDSRVSELGSVCTRITDGTHQPPKWAANGIPFLFVSNIRGRKIDFNTEKFISNDTYRELTRNCPIEAGDVLYTTVGSYGNSAVVPKRQLFAFQRHIAHLKPNRSLIEPEYLAVLMESSFVRRQADRLARGIAQKTLNLAEIRSFKVMVPALGDQREFLKRSRGIAVSNERMVASEKQLDSVFSSLQHRAFRGEL